MTIYLKRMFIVLTDRSRFLLFGLLVCFAFTVGCQTSANKEGDTPPRIETRRSGSAPLSALKLTFTEGCGQLKSYIADALFERYTSSNFCINCGVTPLPGIPIPAVPSGSIETDGAAAAGDRAPDGVSQTNIQEEGVDEADLVKAGHDGKLYIMAFPISG